MLKFLYPKFCCSTLDKDVSTMYTPTMCRSYSCNRSKSKHMEHTIDSTGQGSLAHVHRTRMLSLLSSPVDSSVESVKSINFDLIFWARVFELLR